MEICHLVAETEWRVVEQAAVEQAAERRRHYRPDSLRTDSFIHCSLPEQVDAVAQRYYAGRDDLLLLTIDAQALDAPLVFEDTTGSGERFPHLYGPLNLDAVVRVCPYRWE